MIETARLLLRRPVPADWDAFRDFMMSDRAAIFGSHGDLGRTFRAFSAELGHWAIFGIGMFAVTRKGEDRPIALVGPWTPPHWPEREIGWMVLDAGSEGQGIAREAAEGALNYVWRVLKWDTVVSYIAEGNARSISLAERLGAVLDPQAEAPGFPEQTVLVYRHPRPDSIREGLA